MDHLLKKKPIFGLDTIFSDQDLDTWWVLFIRIIKPYRNSRGRTIKLPYRVFREKLGLPTFQ